MSSFKLSSKDDPPKDDGVESNVDDMSDTETQRISGKEYNPAPDQRDMRRLGKRQELKRRFRFNSIVGYIIVLGLTWEFSLVVGVFSLSKGGAAGAIWLTLFVCCGMFMICLSMAEMASMAPTSGGQYHWISEFAPRSLQKQLSFAVGWLCALGWQAAMPSVCWMSLVAIDQQNADIRIQVAYIAAQQVLALISVCNRDYVIQGWHGALMYVEHTPSHLVEPPC